MMHGLLVVSYLSVMNPDFVEILLTVRNAPDFSFRVTACQTVGALFQVVGDSFGGTKQISRLDLHGHSSIGVQHLGDEVLATPQMDLLGQVEPYLTDDAEIRLLGCGNAVGPESFAMLKGIQSRQGDRRTVYGCRSPTVQASDFGRKGLRESFARKWLVSAKSLHKPIEPQFRPFQFDPADEELASAWGRKLGPDYRYAGRPTSAPLVREDYKLSVGGSTLLACNDARLVLVRDRTIGQPLIFEWMGKQSPALPAIFLT
jgi:hypothetical protein